jgi:hypothetical protein
MAELDTDTALAAARPGRPRVQLNAADLELDVA